MKRFLLIIALIMGSVSLASAQGSPLCYTTNGSNCVKVGAAGASAWGPLPVTGTVTISGSSLSSVSITGWAGGTLGAMANYGTSPGAVLVPGVNAYITGPVTTVGADGVSNTLSGLQTYARTQCYNGTTWDRCTQIGTGTPGTPNITTVLSVQGAASMTKLLVTPDSVALPANQSVNESQINGVSPLMGNGVTGTGSQRVTVASDNTPFGIKVTDGTNTAAVKAASTAPVATDPAFVVGISPNGINANGSTTSANSAPVVIASDQASVSIKGAGPAGVSAAVPITYSSQYPTNTTTTTPTAVTATTTGTTAATAASLGATASVTNFVCGFTITADATALTTGTAALSGTISGSMSYLQTIVAVTSGASQLTQNFNPCIPASAANTAITITSAAAGTGGNTIVNIWGYRL